MPKAADDGAADDLLPSRASRRGEHSVGGCAGDGLQPSIDRMPKAADDGAADDLLPSPASGRGAGGEGRRLPRHEFVRQLRAHQTKAEDRLWYYLRAHRFLGLKFRRQTPIGPYVVDFVCMEFKLIVEADGGQHGSLCDFDRDTWLRDQGYTVLRFWNNQILQELNAVLETIRQAVIAKAFVEAPALRRIQSRSHTS